LADNFNSLKVSIQVIPHPPHSVNKPHILGPLKHELLFNSKCFQHDTHVLILWPASHL